MSTGSTTTDKMAFYIHFSLIMLIFIFSSGVTRQIGFVGYKTPEEAQEAVKFFNNSFLGTSKISVEFADAV